MAAPRPNHLANDYRQLPVELILVAFAVPLKHNAVEDFQKRAVFSTSSSSPIPTAPERM
jgi:hypothetical protein